VAGSIPAQRPSFFWIEFWCGLRRMITELKLFENRIFNIVFMRFSNTITHVNV